MWWHQLVLNLSVDYFGHVERWERDRLRSEKFNISPRKFHGNLKLAKSGKSYRINLLVHRSTFSTKSKCNSSQPNYALTSFEGNNLTWTNLSQLKRTYLVLGYLITNKLESFFNSLAFIMVNGVLIPIDRGEIGCCDSSLVPVVIRYRQ